MNEKAPSQRVYRVNALDLFIFAMKGGKRLKAAPFQNLLTIYLRVFRGSV